MGATYFFDKGSISGDIDLTNNSPIGFMKRSQVIAIGGDYQLLNWLTLRAGFGENINDSESGTATFGIGMRWDIFRLDMTAMAGSSTRGLSLQMTTEL